RQPPARPAGHVWTLEAGYYVLGMVPEQKGVVTLSLRPVLAGKTAGTEVPVSVPSQATARLGVIKLTTRDDYTLYLNQIPETPGTLLVRPLPVDLGRVLPVSLAPGETLDIPVRVPEPGTLQARREDGNPAEIRIDAGEWRREAVLAAGQYTVHLRAPSGREESLTLGLQPSRLASTTPLPPLPDTALTTLPRFPELTAAAPQFFDLARNTSRTFALRVEQPALYRLESTGLLHTAASLRTRVNPVLAKAKGNGAGRNALIQDYLGTGDYQFTVSAQGTSQGHAGVELTATPLRDGGLLEPDQPFRATLAAGEGLSLRFRVEEAGEYRLRALGLGQVFNLRLEDGAGWPVVAPNQPADLTLALTPGEYHAILLPMPVTARVLTLLEPIRPVPVFTGHGPHPLPFETLVAHLWEEPATRESPRIPDQWDFKLPAKAHVAITLDNDMRGDLVPLTGADEGDPVARVAAGRGWKGELTTGRYRLKVAQRRVNHRVPYSLSINVEELIAGLSREVEAPKRIPIAVDGNGLTEILSVGDSDVRAQLLDAEGLRVARADDREDDWNFHLAERLAPGRYTLDVQPVAEESATTRIFLRQSPEQREAPLTLPSHWKIQDDAVHLYPLILPAGQALPVRLPAQRRLRVDAAPGNGPLLFLAESRVGQPALQVPGIPAGFDSTSGMAVAVALDAPQASAELWNALDPGLPLETQIRALRFSLPDEQTLGWGETRQNSLDNGAAQFFNLPAGDKTLALTLPPLTAAVLVGSESGQVPEVYWSGEQGLSERVTTGAERLLLLSAGAIPASHTLTLSPASAPRSAPLMPGGLWQQTHAAAGVTHLTVAKATRLHAIGAEQVLFLGAEGQVQKGSDLLSAGPGRLILHHGPGVLVVWAEQPETPETLASAAAADVITPPAAVVLTGSHQALRFNTTEPALLELTTDTPVIARWVTGRESPLEQVTVSPFGAHLDLLAPAGEAHLTLHAVGDGQLSGSARFVAIPVEPLAEGIGQERLLASGTARAWIFTLDQPRQVGLGLRATPDRVRGRLLDSRGHLLGEGVLYFEKLPAGAYLLMAEAPATTAPLRIQPVALGLIPSDQGTPPALIRRFVEAGSTEGLVSALTPSGQLEKPVADEPEHNTTEAPHDEPAQEDADQEDAPAPEENSEGEK
ncbi:MAG: hypothetical protein WCP34_06850, partial [Pseudomonadota bacterium]